VNKEMLAKNVGKQVRLRPTPLLVGYLSAPALRQGRAVRLPPTPFDHLWLVEAVDGREIRLKDVSSDYYLPLGLDNVREYRTAPRSDGFLLLKCQVIVEANRIRTEPIGNTW